MDCQHTVRQVRRLITSNVKSKKLYIQQKRKIKKTEMYLIPTTTLKSSSNDLLMYFRKLNVLPGAKWTYNDMQLNYTSLWAKLGIFFFFWLYFPLSSALETYRDESMSHGEIVSLTNRPEKLSREAYLQGLDIPELSSLYKLMKRNNLSITLA